MNMTPTSTARYIDQTYNTYSRNLQALNLFHGRADVVSILARKFINKGTSHTQSDLHVLLLRKLLPHVSEKPDIIKLNVDLSSLDSPRTNVCSWLKCSSIAIKCIFRKAHDTPSARVFMLFPTSLVVEKKIHKLVLGNVDVFLLNPKLIEKKDPLNIETGSFEALKLITPRLWMQIAKHLDGGQRLNLGEISIFQSSDTSFRNTRDPYQQHYYQLKHYLSNCPNGSLIQKPMNSPFFVVHQTAYKKEILESTELRVSRGGCIGNLVYTTELTGPSGLDLGGHAIGLLQRKSVAPNEYPKNLILAVVNKTGNVWTNWIDKFGRGMLVSLARNQILSKICSKKALETDINAQNQSLLEYEKLFPFFQLALLISSCIQDATRLNPQIAQKLYTNFRLLYSILNTSSRSSLLNSIYFEIIKDYILLFQNDASSIRFLQKQSFNMGLQYQIFFELCPDLKKNWDTTKFQPSLENVERVLKQKGFLDSQDQLQEFKIFFLERLAYYINLSLLEARSILPDPKDIKHYDEISKHTPNLAHLLYYYSLKANFKKTAYFDLFCESMRAEYQRFYEERNINIAVKCGFARTEEVGLEKTSEVSFLSFEIRQTTDIDASLIPKEIISSLKIKGVSTTNGFTNRLQIRHQSS